MFLGLLHFSLTNAQSSTETDTLTYYFKGKTQVATKDSADYTLLIFPKNSTSKNLYPVLELLKDGKPKLSVMSRTHSLKLELEGPGTAYFPNGSRLRTVTYKNGRMDGDVTEFYPNGNYLRISQYKDGVQNGEVKEFYPNGKIYTLQLNTGYNHKIIECWDSTGVALAKKGNGTWIDYNDNFKAIRQIKLKNGYQSGAWQPVIDTVAEAAYNKTGEVVSVSDVDLKPDFPGGINAFGHFLGKNIHYPVYGRQKGISGTVIVQFIVEKDGNLTDVHATKGPDLSLMNEAVRVMNLSPVWSPGIKDNKLVRVNYTVPISFSLGDEPVSKETSGKYLTEREPEFPGGLDAFGNFLSLNLKYPKIDIQNKVSGKVILRFIVQKDGSIDDIKPLRGPSQTLIDEAIRVLKLSPKWKPAVQNENPVKANYTVPISFNYDIPK